MAGVPAGLAAEGGLFARLRHACAAEWRAYAGHTFVRRLADGSLPEPCFRHYLIQDYLFLIQFARAYALAVYKSDRLGDMRDAAAVMSAILDQEMRLHIAYCADWGIDAKALEATPEATGTLAYTRFVLERGMAGDVLDLHVALAPCVVGYAEIATGIANDPAIRLEGHPYRAWIETYSGADYRGVARAKADLLDRLGAERGGDARFASLARSFGAACRLEAGFWQMGLDRSL